MICSGCGARCREYLYGYECPGCGDRYTPGGHLATAKGQTRSLGRAVCWPRNRLVRQPGYGESNYHGNRTAGQR